MKLLTDPRHDKVSRLTAALRAGLLAGAVILSSPAFAGPQGASSIDPSGLQQVADSKKAGKKAGSGKSNKKTEKKAAGTSRKNAKQKPGPLADFGQETAPPEVVHTANWVSYTRNHKKKAFVVIDKKAAQLYVFDPRGKLRSSTPILLGKAVGDDTAPGVGDKPLSQIKEEEKTTPAGRFLASPGKNTRGDDIIWIDYAAGVSMHRLRKVSAEEQRAERMATPEADDNRISNGCVNVPPDFYNRVLKPTVVKHGAYVYVLPETRTPQQQFGSVDVQARDKGMQTAKAPAAARG